MKIVNSCLLCAVALTNLLAGTFAFAASRPRSGEFDQIYSVVSPRYTMKTIDHVVFKGARLIRESEDHEQFLPFTDIMDGQNFYRYLATQNTALRIDSSEKQLSALDELKQQTDQMTAGSEKSGEATVNGFPCQILTRTVDGTSKVTMYESTDPEFPYVLKTVYTASDLGLTTTASIENIKLNIAVSDDLFIIPKGTKIIQQPKDVSGTVQHSPDASQPQQSDSQNSQGSTTPINK